MSTQPSIFDSWPWPDSLDALVAAPKHHSLVLENEYVRVVHTHIPPGDLVPVHTHRWPSVAHTLQGSDFIRRDDRGNVLFDSRQAAVRPPAIQWLGPLPPHTVENVGANEISLLIVEIKSSSADRK
ncbi:MAG TPA: hypothetical protein VFB00_10690 [Terriglobales bacterium]|nr:hypothetical protein [Terriglobales bacterium]